MAWVWYWALELKLFHPKKAVLTSNNTINHFHHSLTVTNDVLLYTRRDSDYPDPQSVEKGEGVKEVKLLTQIQGCLRASVALIRLAGLTVNILLIRFLASGVTVSHSGEGYCNTNIHKHQVHKFSLIQAIRVNNW